MQKTAVRSAHRRGRTGRTEEEIRGLKRKALVLPLVLAVFGILTAVMFTAIDNRDIFSLDQFLNRDLYNVVEIGGVRCRRRTRIKSYLFMGVDARGKVGEHVEEDRGGQCDVLELIVIDQNADTYTVFPINRDTVATVKSLREDGSLIAESDVQIAFAHAMGDGREISCENAVDAVSHLLYDQPIDGYLALNMDSIGVINHQLGGVTVTIEDDFSQVDPNMKIGDTIKLTDEQAQYFVRGRMEVADGTNENRMSRQEQFLTAAQPILQERIMSDENFFRELYDALGDYMVTSLSGKDISKLAKALRSNEYFDPPKTEGEITLDEYGFRRLYINEDSLAEAVFQLFYEKV